MPTEGVGPRHTVPLDELPRDLPVRAEIIGSDDLETGWVSIHDPDYIEPSSTYVEMELGDALEVADDFCIDCFTQASLDFSLQQREDDAGE